MGYELEYNEQSRVLRNMECNLSDIEDELKMLVTLVDNINQVWTSDAGEKYYIIMAIQQVRKSLGKDIGCLRTFALSAKGYLKQMQEFEKYTPKVVKGTCSVTNINALKSKKTKVICDLTRLQEVQGKLNSCARRIKRLSNTVNMNVAQVDGTMANVVSGGKSVLKKYVNDITHQAGQVEKIGKVIVQITENYKKAEDNIKKITDGLKNGTILAVTSDGVITEDGKQDFGNWINSINKKDVKTINVDLKGLSNIFGTTDNLVENTKKIHKLLKDISQEDIPQISKILSLYGDVKEYTEELVNIGNDLRQGKNPFKKITAKDLANFVEKKGDVLFQTSGVGWLAGTCFSYTDNYLKRLEEWNKTGGTGNIWKDSWHIWGGAISDTVNGKVQKTINRVKDSVVAIYDVSDVLAGFAGVDLDAEYQKYGINIRGGIEGAARGTKQVIDAGTSTIRKGLGHLGKTVASWL